MGIAIRWILSTLAILLAARLLDGIRVESFAAAFFAAAALGVLNALLRPLVLVLTLPVTVLTFGLFIFVVNALMLKLASGLIPGFDVIGFWPALGGSLIVSLVGWLLNWLLTALGVTL